MDSRRCTIRLAGGFRSSFNVYSLSSLEARCGSCPTLRVGKTINSFTGIETPANPSTRRSRYYARNRHEEGDAVLAQLNDADVDSENVQYTRREILAAIESELEASASLHWKDFLTMGIVDKTRMKIIRRICICFWLPMIREWASILIGKTLLRYLRHLLTILSCGIRWVPAS